jgi:hypothetical protein
MLFSSGSDIEICVNWGMELTYLRKQLRRSI